MMSKRAPRHVFNNLPWCRLCLHRWNSTPPPPQWWKPHTPPCCWWWWINEFTWRALQGAVCRLKWCTWCCWHPMYSESCGKEYFKMIMQLFWPDREWEGGLPCNGICPLGMDHHLAHVSLGQPWRKHWPDKHCGSTMAHSYSLNEKSRNKIMFWSQQSFKHEQAQLRGGSNKSNKQGTCEDHFREQKGQVSWLQEQVNILVCTTSSLYTFV